MTEIATIPDPFGQPAKPSAQMSPSARAASTDGPQDVKRDAFQRYLLPTGKDGKDKPYTRATTFAKSISDTFTLSAWSQRMAIKGITMDAGLYAAVASTPLSDKKEMNRLAEAGKEKAGAKTAASIGTALHAFTEQADRGDLDLNVVPPLWRRGITTYLELLDASGFEIVPELIERIVLEERFEIAGTFDRIVRASRDVVLTMPNGTLTTIAEGEHVVLDLKTGRDLSYGWNEIVIQLALYARASTMLSEDRKTMEAKPVTRTDVALVIHLPAEKITEEKAEADLYAIDIDLGWSACQLCEAVRTWRKVRKLAVPIAHAEVDGRQIADSDEGNQQTGTIKVSAERVPVSEVKLMKPSTQAHIDACTTEKELKDLVHDLRIARQFTPDVEAYAQARLTGIRADTAPA